MWWLLVLVGGPPHQPAAVTGELQLDPVTVTAQEPTAQELRAALDAMRAGQPGEPAFDGALDLLPALIESGSGWWVAGAAYLAGKHGRKECLPALLAALEHENARGPRTSGNAKASILDALVQLDLPVPLTALTERLESETLAETYLLMLREPDAAARAQALLTLFDRAPEESLTRWATACTLTAERADGLAERLVAHMAWAVVVCVSDADSSSVHSGGGGGFGSSHPRWPPRVIYRLQLPGEDEPLEQVRHRRTEHRQSGSSVAKVYLAERGAWRVRLLEHLIGHLLGHAPGGLLVSRSEDLSLVWNDGDDYRRALRGHLGDLRSRIGLVIEQLELAPELLDEVVIRVSVQDLRSDRKQPLPTAPKLRGVVYSR